MRKPYEPPAVAVLGSVTELTQQDTFSLSFDGVLSLANNNDDPTFS